MHHVYIEENIQSYVPPASKDRDATGPAKVNEKVRLTAILWFNGLYNLVPDVLIQLPQVR